MAMNTNKISYNKYVAELIGTLVLVLIIAIALSAQGLTTILFSGLALAFVVYLFSDISGAHFNPAFTIAAFTMKKIKWQDALLYLCAQFIGAGLALIIIKSMGGASGNLTDTMSASKLFVSEMVGAAIFSMSFAATLHGKTTRSNVGFVMGMGLFIGALFANVSGGLGILNPAVAVGISALHWATIVGPIVGAFIGAWIYRFIVYGNLCGCDEEGTSCGWTMFHKKSKVHNHENGHNHDHSHNHHIASNENMNNDSSTDSSSN